MARRKQGAGNYNHKMILEEPTQGDASASGAVTDTWAEVAEMWCSLYPIRGREYWARQQVQADTTHVMETWWRNDVTIDTTMRFRSGSRLFYIESFIDVDEGRRKLEFMVREKP